MHLINDLFRDGDNHYSRDRPNLLGVCYVGYHYVTIWLACYLRIVVRRQTSSKLLPDMDKNDDMEAAFCKSIPMQQYLQLSRP